MKKIRIFNHADVFKTLNEFGFNRIGNDNYSIYVNNRNNVVSYYVEKRNTPEKKAAFVFIHNKMKLYAYDINDFENTYLNLIKII
jgi:L-rhamnose mutarotase